MTNEFIINLDNVACAARAFLHVYLLDDTFGKEEIAYCLLELQKMMNKLDADSHINFDTKAYINEIKSKWSLKLEHPSLNDL
jgi:hypothetical protein